MVVCGVVVVMIGGGLRQSFGVFLRPVSIDLEIGRQFFGLVIAAQALIYGVSQPVAGLLADRVGYLPVMVGGGSMALGVAALALWGLKRTARFAGGTINSA